MVLTCPAAAADTINARFAPMANERHIGACPYCRKGDSLAAEISLTSLRLLEMSAMEIERMLDRIDHTRANEIFRETRAPRA